MKRNLARLAITAVLLFLILSRVDWGEFRRIGSQVQIAAVLLAYGLNLSMIGLNTFRWQILVRALGTRVSAPRLASYYLVCMFFNSFMPTSVGGDVMRVIDLSRHTGKKSSAMASILVERLLGLYALFPIYLAAFLLLYPELPRRDLFLVAAAGMATLFLAGTILIRRRTIRRIEPLFRPYQGLIDRLELREKASRLYDHLDLFKGRKGTVLAALSLSVLSRSVWVIACWVFARSTGLELPLPVFFLLMPLVEVGRMIPISLAGMGIREGLFVLILDLFGVTATPAIFVSLLVYGVFVFNGLLGGAVYGLRGFFRRRQTL